MIYADNAATTKLDNDAFEAMKPFLLEEYGNASQPYSFARPAKRALKQARITIAECIGALPEEIYFTSGGTESDNWAIKGIAFQSFGRKKNIITTEIEHHAVLHSCESLIQFGYDIIYLPVDQFGLVSAYDLEKAINEDTILVSVMMANNEIGTIMHIKELVDVARSRNIPFHTDAVQAVGHIPINVNTLGVDMLSASAHKFNGPKGVGFLYVNKNLSLGNFIDGGSQEKNHRAGTENIAGIVGMYTALQKNCKELNSNSLHLKKLVSNFQEQIRVSGLDYLLNGSSIRIPGSVSISFKNESGETLMHRLDLMGIQVSTGSACNSKKTELSHVLKAIKVPDKYAEGTIRITLGKENSAKDVCDIIEALKRIIL